MAIQRCNPRNLKSNKKNWYYRPCNSVFGIGDLSIACYTMAYNEHKNAPLWEEVILLGNSKWLGAAAASRATVLNKMTSTQVFPSVQGRDSYWISSLTFLMGTLPRERTVGKNGERNCCENCRRKLTSDITGAYFEHDVAECYPLENEN